MSIRIKSIAHHDDGLKQDFPLHSVCLLTLARPVDHVLEDVQEPVTADESTGGDHQDEYLISDPAKLDNDGWTIEKRAKYLFPVGVAWLAGVLTGADVFASAPSVVQAVITEPFYIAGGSIPSGAIGVLVGLYAVAIDGVFRPTRL